MQSVDLLQGAFKCCGNRSPKDWVNFDEMSVLFSLFLLLISCMYVQFIIKYV